MEKDIFLSDFQQIDIKEKVDTLLKRKKPKPISSANSASFAADAHRLLKAVSRRLLRPDTSPRLHILNACTS